MNETPDPLEAELAAFRPAEVSPELRRRIAAQMAGSTPKPGFRLRTIALAGGLAAVILAALLFGRSRGPGINNGLVVVGPTPSPSYHTDDALPSLRAYRQALARSPEDFDALLDQHATRNHGPDSELVRIRAFNSHDPGLQVISGEL